MNTTDLHTFTQYMDVFSSLNEQQKAAVEHDQTPVLVIAGAGSGKTRIITCRIAYLMLEKKVPASAIIALTFTNKAALQMKERIATLIESGSVPFVGTFHSYCVLLLRKYGSRINLSAFSIIDEEDQKKIISDILHRNGLHKQYTPKTILSAISQMKNHVLDTAREAQAYLVHPLIYDVYQSYEREKKAANCLDFDDLMHAVVRLFKTDLEFKLLFQGQIRHVLVDEYQDTNTIQHALLVHMCKYDGNLVAQTVCVVGDEDQSIYSWRGATITNILHFNTDFPTACTIKVEQNYRSVQPILDLSNHLIAHNVQRNQKRLWSDKKASDRIRIIVAGSQYQEADAVVQMMKTATLKNDTYSRAVLYRTHTQSRSLEEAFIRHAVPYKIIGGVQFYERKEIKDILAYLRLLVNPYDRVAFMRVLNVPTRGLGPKVEEDIKACWSNEPFIAYHEVIDHLIASGSVAGKKRESLQQFKAIFEDIDQTQKPTVIVESIINRTRYLSYIAQEYEPVEAQERTAIVTELINAIAYLEKEKIQTIQEFLQEVMLMQELISNQSKDVTTGDCVLLMTIHAAKGLEFDCVAVVGLEEGIFPSLRSQYEDAALEEERRLLYVALTRAREWLLLLCAKSRYIYGSLSDQRKSRFFDNIAALSILEQDITFYRTFQLNTYFADWFIIQQKTHDFSSFGYPFADQKNTELVKTTSSFLFNKTKSPLPLEGEWAINQRVTHAVFGEGFIKEVDTRPQNMVYVTVDFLNGMTKKLLAKFVQKG